MNMIRIVSQSELVLKALAVLRVTLVALLDRAC
jgi:hypothetical protein